MPLIGIGSIFTPEDALSAFETGVEFIALGRELLLDSRFIEKLKTAKQMKSFHTLIRHAKINTNCRLTCGNNLMKILPTT